MKQFVQNRVDENLGLTGREQWFHCKGTENPADFGTHRILPSQLEDNSLRFHGPLWLSEGPKNWPLKELSEIQPTKESLKGMKGPSIESNEQLVLFTKTETEPTTNLAEIINPENYSNIHHLYDVTGYVLRFVNNLKKKVKNEKGNITVEGNLISLKHRKP